MDRRYSASFTIEATMVLSIVFTTIAWMIQHAYTQYDQITGTMILEEMVINARNSMEENQADSYIEEIGKKLANPRLWLGEYQLEIKRTGKYIEGTAFAGEWSQEIAMEYFDPGDFLRKVEGIKRLGGDGDEKDDRGT